MKEGFYNGCYFSFGVQYITPDEVEDLSRLPARVKRASRGEDGLSITAELLGGKTIPIIGSAELQFLDSQVADSVLRNLSAKNPKDLVGKMLLVLNTEDGRPGSMNVGFTID